MLSEFITYIQEHQLLRISRDKILLGISGGVDSMVLLHLFKKAGIKFGVAHCNYQLRGAASDADAHFVKQYAQQLNVPFHSRCFDTSAIAASTKSNIQALARSLRYDWFHQLCDEHEYDYIAVGHHQNDVVETLLMNLTKGCGIRGLHGIYPKRDNIIRPILFATKTQLTTFADEQQIEFREDASNNSLKYVRNAIRHQVVPALQQINPELEKTMDQNIGIFRQVEALYHFAIETLKEQVLHQEDGMLHIDIDKVCQSPAPTSLLFEILRPFHFKINKIEYIYACRDEESGSIYTSKTHQLLRDRKAWIVAPNTLFENINSYKLQLDDAHGHHQLDDLRIEWSLKAAIDFTNQDKLTAYFSPDKLKMPLTLRHWQAGDYFFPAGMQGKKKKLSKYFKDVKMNRFDKDRTWLLCNADGAIIWLIGQREDERFRVQQGDKKILEIRVDIPKT